jgi:hypothetical protein
MVLSSLLIQFSSCCFLCLFQEMNEMLNVASKQLVLLGRQIFCRLKTCELGYRQNINLV